MTEKNIVDKLIERERKQRIDGAIQRTVFSIEIPAKGHAQECLDGDIRLRIGVPNRLLLLWMVANSADELCIVTSTNPHGRQLDVAQNWERWAQLTDCIGGRFDSATGEFVRGQDWYVCHSRWIDTSPTHPTIEEIRPGDIVGERTEIHAAVLNMDKAWATTLCQRFEQDSFVYVRVTETDAIPELVVVS